MDNHKSVEEFILGFPNTKLTYPFGEDVAVYKVTVDDDEKMFALLPENKSPMTLSLKCDPVLGKILREKYESVMEGYHLNKKHWITILLTGQLTDDEVEGLILHSYNLVTGTVGDAPTFNS
jgi:predicted DNA-binding protein (MmcQ/YjbR family)